MVSVLENLKLLGAENAFKWILNFKNLFAVPIFKLSAWWLEWCSADNWMRVRIPRYFSSLNFLLKINFYIELRIPRAGQFECISGASGI